MNCRIYFLIIIGKTLHLPEKYDRIYAENGIIQKSWQMIGMGIPQRYQAAVGGQYAA